ncbi:MAG: DUF481 domain-containing protein [Gammaproteobacteria bacterium]|nr:DUF481 domain-containing protein [Gammaproteobacteria bacterium]
MSFNRNIVLFSALTLSPAAFAVTGDSQWGGEAELGLVTTSGNTETTTANFKGKLENTREQWHNLFTLQTLHASSKNSNTAERYLITAKSDYKVNDVSYAFGRFSYEDDRFSGFDYRATETLGYGRHIIREETFTFDVEGGPGLRQSKPEIGSRDSETILYLSGNLKWDVSATSVFTQDLFSEIGEDVTITKSVTGLKTQINGDLAMKMTYTVKKTSEVPVGIDKIDTETAVTLVYSF